MTDGREEVPVLEVQGFTKKFKDFVAVDGLSFEVRRGDVYGFLGPNGSGKSTTIRAILGLVSPTAGEVRLFGQAVGGPDSREGLAGFVDSPGFYGYLSARDNLKILAAADGRKKEPAIDQVLETVDLAGRAGDRVKTYSTGMKQRLAIAAALLREPELLILDEPTNGLDPGGMRDVRALIRRLADEGITIFLSSHLLAEIEGLCNRVAVIGHGRLLAEGEIADVMGGAATVSEYRLAVRDSRRAAEVLRASDSVQGVQGPVKGELGEELRLRVEVGGIGPVVRELVSAGVEVWAVVPVRRSLEDLFLELTEGAA